MMTMRIGGLLRTRRDRLVLGAGAVIVAAALVAGGVLVYRSTHKSTQVTAYFSEAIGVYPGSTVRVLGVPVGTVDSIQPQGTEVKVTMTVNSGVPVPPTPGPWWSRPAWCPTGTCSSPRPTPAARSSPTTR